MCKHSEQDWKTYIDYAPSQEQIDLSTDKDEVKWHLVCLGCGKVLDPDE